MKQDIMINIDSRDIRIRKDSPVNAVYCDVIWGRLLGDDDDNVVYANIIIPQGDVERAKKISSIGTYTCYIHATYMGVDKPFNARLITNNSGTYNIIDNQLLNANVKSLLNSETPKLINACQLPIIDYDGYYLVMFRKGVNYSSTAYIYSAGKSDFEVGTALPQEMELLSLVGPGKYYRYPLSGVDITKYINSIASHTDLASIISDEFLNDNIPASEAEFDALTGKLNVVATEANIYEQEEDLTPVDELDLQAFMEISAEATIKTVLYEYYDDIVVSLSYPTARSAGGVVRPNISYSQRKTVVYDNGTSSSMLLTSGATLVWSGTDSVVDGRVTVGPTESFLEQAVKEVSVSVSMNGKTTIKRHTIMQKGVTPVVVATHYEAPVVYLSYPVANANGETLFPSLTYKQKKVMDMSDGSVVTEDITSGASIYWENTDSPTDGRVTVPFSELSVERDVVTVKVQVTMNGQSSIASFTIRQEAGTMKSKYYYGMIDGRSAAFAALSADDLTENAVAGSTELGGATGDRYVIATKHIFYLMLPVSATLTKFAFISDGSTSNILGDNSYNVFHDNIKIRGIEHKIYACRDATTTADNPLEYVYNIKF